MTLEGFLARFSSAHKRGSYFMVKCPCHDDGTASLSVSGVEDKILINCQAGCDSAQILQSMGLTFEDLFLNNHQRKPNEKNEIAYVYHTINGLELFRKVRMMRDGKKTFIQQAKDPNGAGWLRDRGGLEEEANILYRLPKVIEAVKKGETIYIQEGEKACDAFASKYGVVSTCQPNGADKTGQKWLEKYTNYLKGAKLVVIVQDRDEVGRIYAGFIASKLRAAGIPTLIKQSKTEFDKHDGYDHVVAGYKLEDLQNAPRESAIIKSRVASNIEELAVEWLWEPYIPIGMLTIIDGDPSIGKSFLSCALAAAVSMGYPMPPNQVELPIGRVIYFATEDDPERTIIPRLNKHKADLSRISIIDHGFAFNRAGLAELEEEIRSFSVPGEPTLVIIDPLMSFISRAMNEKNSDLNERFIMEELKAIASRTQAAIVFIRHLNKASGQTGNMMYQGIGSIDIVAACRSAMAVKYHPEEKGLRIITHYKMNLAPEGESLAYRIIEGEVQYIRGGADGTNQETFASSPRRVIPEAQKNAISQAIDYLRQVLGSGHMVMAKELEEEAKSIGINRSTLFKAKQEINVRAKKQGFGKDGIWLWYLEDSLPLDPDEDAHVAAPETPQTPEDYDPFAD